MPPDPTAVRLRPATTADASALARLHAWSWQVTYGPLLREDERERLTVEERQRLWDRVVGAPRPREATIVAEDATGAIVGLVFVGPSEDTDAETGTDGGTDVGEVHAIHVAPGLHGRGIG